MRSVLKSSHVRHSRPSPLFGDASANSTTRRWPLDTPGVRGEPESSPHTFRLPDPRQASSLE